MFSPKTKKRLLVILGIILFSIIAYIVSLIMLFSILSSNQMFKEDLDYYKIIKAETKYGEIRLDKIFTFEWDKVYIQKDPRMSEEDVSEKLGFPCEIGPLDEHNGYPYRLVFIKDDRDIYEFHYDTKYLEFEPMEMIIDKESAIFIADKHRRLIKLKIKE